MLSHLVDDADDNCSNRCVRVTEDLSCGVSFVENQDRLACTGSYRVDRYRIATLIRFTSLVEQIAK
jgi:hypothetical protein